MKRIFTFLFLLFSVGCFSQSTDTLKTQGGKKSYFVSFVTKLDIGNLTKDGIYLEGYVVNISSEQAKKLDGKKIRITGKARVIKGNANSFEQVRQGNYKYIEYPKIEVIKN